MTQPLELPHGHYLLLLALSVGERLGVNDDGLVTLTDPCGGEPIAIPSLPEALDELESRGMLAVGESGPHTTESGEYWLKRWMTKRLGKGRLTGVRLVTRRAA